MSTTTPRSITYDYRTASGVVLIDEGQSLDAKEVVALFAAIDPEVRVVKVIFRSADQRHSL
jgi:hypothetical protein